MNKDAAYYAIENLVAALKATGDALLEVKNLVDSIDSEPVTEGAHQAFLNKASDLYGVPYVWGGQDKNGVDCSGLIVYALRQLGRVGNDWDATSQYMWDNFPRVDDNPQNGDLFIFKISDPADHVGIRVDYRRMLHAPQPDDFVKIVSIDSDWWMTRLMGIVCPVNLEQH